MLGDPAASRPQDLDDPFVDANAQRRVADVIARAAEQKIKRRILADRRVQMVG